jgi:hypothetical protein
MCIHFSSRIRRLTFLQEIQCPTAGLARLKMTVVGRESELNAFIALPLLFVLIGLQLRP